MEEIIDEVIDTTDSMEDVIDSEDGNTSSAISLDEDNAHTEGGNIYPYRKELKALGLSFNKHKYTYQFIDFNTHKKKLNITLISMQSVPFIFL